MELAPKRPSPLWFWGPNSIIAVYMDPLGYLRALTSLRQSVRPSGPVNQSAWGIRHQGLPTIVHVEAGFLGFNPDQLISVLECCAHVFLKNVFDAEMLLFTVRQCQVGHVFCCLNLIGASLESEGSASIDSEWLTCMATSKPWLVYPNVRVPSFL